MAAPIPRDAPVTRATRFSRLQKSGGSEHLLELSETVGIPDGDGAKRPVAAPKKTAQNLARTDLDEQTRALAAKRARCLREPNGRG